jgi:hypothetical protein
LANHLAAVGQVRWGGMQGTGKITYASGDPTAYDATLSNLGADRFRLDAQTKKGPTSIRIHRFVGKIQGSDGAISVIPSTTAALGLFPFELPRFANSPGLASSLIDQGLVALGGTELHRITLELGSLGRNPVTKSIDTIVTDLYFDPTSHLLIKSVSSVLIAGSRPVKLLSVVTYGDYRMAAGSMVPFRYTETLEGQPYRTLQLSNVQLNPELNTTYFEF